MKNIYLFKVNKETLVEKEEIITNEAGEQIKQTKKVKELIPQEYFIKKPTRSDFDEAELYYGVKLAEGIKSGMLTKSMLVKRFSNDGGLLSEPQKDKYGSLYLDLATKENDLQRIILQEQNEEVKQQKQKLEAELIEIRREIQDFETSQSAIFEQTAENRARNKLIFWWTLFLSYRLVDGKESPLFVGTTIDEKVKSYDAQMEDPEPHFQDVVQKFIYFITMWYVGQANNQKEFEDLARVLEESVRKP